MIRMTTITDQKGKLLGAITTKTGRAEGAPLQFVKHPRAEQSYTEIEVPDDFHQRHPDEMHKVLLEHMARKRS